MGVALQTTHMWIKKVWYFKHVRRGLAARGWKVCSNGSVWGEDMVLSSDLLRDCTPTVALTYCEMLALTRPALFEICGSFPTERDMIRRATVRLAVFRGIIRHAIQKRRRTVTDVINMTMVVAKGKSVLDDVQLGGSPSMEIQPASDTDTP